MKTIKTILSIVLVALTTSLYARIAEPEAECTCCPSDIATDVVIELDVNLETWMSVPFEAGVLEADVFIENWMSVPFEASLDEELSLESWMTVPFKSTLEDEELKLESWMAVSWI